MRNLPAATALAILLAGPPAAANGFFLPQQSTSQHGRAFAGNAAIAEDASVVFANPAAMTELGGAGIRLDAAVIVSSLNLRDEGSVAVSPGSLGQPVPTGGDDGGNPASVVAVPTLFAAAPLDGEGRVWAGLALTAPFGQRLNYGPGWFGRYDATRAELATVDLSPSLAVRLAPWLSLGAGVHAQFAKARLENALPDPFAPGGPSPASDGLGRLDGDGFAFGYDVGLHVRPAEGLALGLHYRSGVRHELTGDLGFAGYDGPAAALNGRFRSRTRFDLPDVLTASLAYDLTPELTLAAQGQWFGWDRFRDISIDIGGGAPPLRRTQNYRNGWMLGVGGIWRADEDWSFRAGVSYDRTPTRDAFRNTAPPDASRLWLSVGVSHRLTKRAWLDLGITHVEFAGSDFDTTTEFFGGTPLATSASTRGSVETRVTTIGVGVRISLP